MGMAGTAGLPEQRAPEQGVSEESGRGREGWDAEVDTAPEWESRSKSEESPETWSRRMPLCSQPARTAEGENSKQDRSAKSAPPQCRNPRLSVREFIRRRTR
jgi:hypothetical protein